MIITRRELHAVGFGLSLGLLVAVSVWIGALLAPSSREILADRARCDSLGWVTIQFPDGGQYMCTPTEQKPLNTVPDIRKPKKSKKTEKVELPAPTVPAIQPKGLPVDGG